MSMTRPIRPTVIVMNLCRLLDETRHVMASLEIIRFALPFVHPDAYHNQFLMISLVRPSDVIVPIQGQADG